MVKETMTEKTEGTSRSATKAPFHDVGHRFSTLETKLSMRFRIPKPVRLGVLGAEVDVAEA